MSIQAHHGSLPDAALQAAIRRGESISGRVLPKGEAMLVEDIAHSEFAALAQRGLALGGSLMGASIRIEGVSSASGPRHSTRRPCACSKWRLSSSGRPCS